MARWLPFAGRVRLDDDVTEASPPPAASAGTAAPPDLTSVLTSRGYHALLVVAALIGVPVAIIAFGFLALATKLEDWVWLTVPKDFGWTEPTGWYAVLVLTLAGLLVGLVVVYLPGRGGHIAVKGLGAGGTLPIDLPGMLLAALASLVLGAVLGPEAPLTALGGGLVLLTFNRTRLGQQPQGLKLLAVAGSAAAIATIFGNPLVAVVLMLEVVGLAGIQVILVLLPCMVSAGVGALIFTGMGNWTGIDVPSLTIPGLPAASLDFGDLVWVAPVAILCAIGAQLARRLGLRAMTITAHRTVVRTTVAGLLVGLCAAVYALTTSGSVLDVLQSGEQALPGLVSSPHSWSVATLLLLLLFKGAAYGISLGSFRGGPTFPAVFLGAALGVLVAPLPGLGTTTGIAIGMAAATTAVLRLPVTSVVLVVLLLGNEAASAIPVVMIAAAIAMVTAVALDKWDRPTKAAAEAVGPAEGAPA
jgi:H+/Cl- antiporter ClcA